MLIWLMVLRCGMATKQPLFRTVLMQSQSSPPLGGEVVFFHDLCERMSHRSSF